MSSLAVAQDETAKRVSAVEEAAVRLDRRAMSGYLKKQGKVMKNWKRRFFIFDGSSRLKYYQEEGGELKGELIVICDHLGDATISVLGCGIDEE